MQNQKPQTLNEILQYIEDLLSNAQTKEALGLCEKLLQENPKSLEIIFLKAIALQMNGHLKRALKVVRMCVRT